MNAEETVRTTFENLSAGRLSEPTGMTQEGWETTLPSGRTVARSQLAEETAPLIALGRSGVPYLLPWVMNDNPAIRYVAIRSLEEITGRRPEVSYFADDSEQRERAVDEWRRWYDEDPEQE